METQVMKLSDRRSVDVVVEKLEHLSHHYRLLKVGRAQVRRIEIVAQGRVGVAVDSFRNESAKALADAAVVLIQQAMEIEHGHLTEQLKALGVEPDTEKTQLNPPPSTPEPSQ